MNASGVEVTEAIDTARFDYTAAGGALGLLVEPAATNLCLRSSGFDTTATWQIRVGHPVATANTKVAPDGTTAGDTLALNVGDGNNWDTYQTWTGLSPGAVYTFSIDVWLGTATNFVVAVNDSTAWNSVVGSRAFTGADGLNTSGWVRVSTRVTVPANGKLNVHLGAHGNSDVVAQVAGTVFVANAQLEIGRVATSRIPTTTVAVTRAADVLTLPLKDGLWDITYTDATGSETQRDVVTSGVVRPRDGSTH